MRKLTFCYGFLIPPSSSPIHVLTMAESPTHFLTMARSPTHFLTMAKSLNDLLQVFTPYLGGVKQLGKGWQWHYDKICVHYW